MDAAAGISGLLSPLRAASFLQMTFKCAPPSSHRNTFIAFTISAGYCEPLNKFSNDTNVFMKHENISNKV